MLHVMSYACFRLFVGALTLLPVFVQRFILNGIGRFFVLTNPKYRRIAHQNIHLAFPEMTFEERRSLIARHLKVLTELVIDLLRMTDFSPEWVEKNVEWELGTGVDALCSSEEPVIFVAGHLASFEAFPTFYRHRFQPLSYVVRALKHPLIDHWWNHQRTYWGNKVITRSGAVRQLLKTLARKQHVGILFDQNVRESHGVYVDWFGRPAATTRAIGLLGIKRKVPVVVAGFFRDSDGRYRIKAEQVATDDIYARVDEESANRADLEQLLTQRCAAIFERYIKECPEGWFWFHRRWKSAPEGSPLQGFYNPENIGGLRWAA